jgi:hypothetical protein
MASFGFHRHVVRNESDISEKIISFIFIVRHFHWPSVGLLLDRTVLYQIKSSLAFRSTCRRLLLLVFCFAYSWNLKVKAIYSAEAPGSLRHTPLCNTEDCAVHKYRHKPQIQRWDCILEIDIWYVLYTTVCRLMMVV